MPTSWKLDIRADTNKRTLNTPKYFSLDAAVDCRDISVKCRYRSIVIAQTIMPEVMWQMSPRTKENHIMVRINTRWNGTGIFEGQGDSKHNCSASPSSPGQRKRCRKTATDDVNGSSTKSPLLKRFLQYLLPAESTQGEHFLFRPIRTTRDMQSYFSL